MNKLAEIPTNVLEPIVRSQIYHMLTLGFSYPSREMYEVYQNGTFMAELLGLLKSLPHLARVAIEEASRADRIRLDLWSVGYQEFELKYATTFEVGYPGPPCPLYQGLQGIGRPRAEVLAELNAFYERFGIAVLQGEDEHELPDYLCAELEFLHFLALKEAQARQNGNREMSKSYLVGQHDFLEHHLGPWMPDLCKKVERIVGLLFYPSLAHIAQRIIESEYALVHRKVTE